MTSEEYYKNNKDKVKLTQKLYRQKNKLKLSTKKHEYYLLNKSEKNLYSKLYTSQNKEKINIRSKLRYHNDSLFKLQRNIRNLIRISFKLQKQQKFSKSQ